MPLVSSKKSARPIRYATPKPLVFTWVISSILLILVSTTLLAAPLTAKSLWPWPLAPFNTAFFGIVYFSAAIPLISYILKPQTTFLKVLLPTFACFTTYFFIVSLAHYGSFLDRRSTDVWFFLYGSDSFVGLLYLWKTHSFLWTPEKREARFSLLYLLQAFILGLYGFCNLLFPRILGPMWSWPLDIVHTHLYSGVFFSGAVAMILLRNYPNVLSRIVFSLVQVCLGFGIALTTWGVDQNMQKLDWTTLHPWLWQFIFMLSGVVPLIILIKELNSLRKQ